MALQSSDFADLSAFIQINTGFSTNNVSVANNQVTITHTENNRIWGGLGDDGTALVQEAGADVAFGPVSFHLVNPAPDSNDYRFGFMVMASAVDSPDDYIWVGHRGNNGGRISIGHRRPLPDDDFFNETTDQNLGAITDMSLERTDNGNGTWNYIVGYSLDNGSTWSYLDPFNTAFAGAYVGPAFSNRIGSATSAVYSDWTTPVVAPSGNTITADVQVEDVQVVSSLQNNTVALRDNLVRHYRLDGGLSDSLGGPDLVYGFNSRFDATQPKPLTFVAGHDGQALDMTVADPVENMPYADTGWTPNDNGDKSLVIWVKTANLTSELVWIGNGAPDAVDALADGRRFYVGTQDGNPFVGVGNRVLRGGAWVNMSDGGWHQITLVVHGNGASDGGTFDVYEDNNLVLSGENYTGRSGGATGTATYGTSYDVIIGMGGGRNNHPSDAQLDNALIFDRALTSADVALINSGALNANAVSADVQVEDVQVVSTAQNGSAFRPTVSSQVLRYPIAEGANSFSIHSEFEPLSIVTEDAQLYFYARVPLVAGSSLTVNVLVVPTDTTFNWSRNTTEYVGTTESPSGTCVHAYLAVV